MSPDEINNEKKRDIKLEKYYENPNFCIHCGNIIEMLPHQKTYEVRVKKFCNHSCSAIYNNLKREKKVKVETPKKERPKKFEYLEGLTKKELFDLRGIYYKFRAIVRKHAHHTFMTSDKPKKCMECGYDKHVEVCHIKSVSEFKEDSLVTEINHIDNLIGLCPTHHWEFDNKLLRIKL